MMKKYGIWVVLLLLSLDATAKVAEVPVEALEPTRQHQNAAMVVSRVIRRFHYKKDQLDDDMSAAIVDRYLEAMDPNKTFFTAADVASLSDLRDELDGDLRRGRLEEAFEVFRLFRARVDERVVYALARLDAFDFDFSRVESYRFDRSDSGWANDSAALNDIWRQRIKHDVITLRLAKTDETEIVKTLRKRYEGIQRRVHQFTADDVFETYLNAFTLSVEPHTSYMSPRASENFDISMRLSLQGIGAVLRTENEYTVVQRIIPGGPASRSGELHAGDRIVGVAQGEGGEMEDVIGWRLQDVVDRIRGKKDSVVRLGILSKGAAAGGPSQQLVLVRDQIKLEDQAAKGSVIEGLPGMGEMRIGVIELPAFYRDFRAQSRGDRDFRSTTRDVRQLLVDLQAKGVHGVVVDLRRNGGGSLTEATELTGLFIDEGPVVQVRNADGNVEVERDIEPGRVYGGPLAVLVDRNSASASEIFAGAIQDYGRGIIIGEPTFGKGTVQTLVEIGRWVNGDDDLGRLRLTMAQFFRVLGASTQHRGVTPDVEFPTAQVAVDQGERAYDNALPWARIEAVDFEPEKALILDGLREGSSRRIAADPGFRYLIDTELELRELQRQDTVMLEQQAREAEWQAREKARLERRNRLRQYRGLEPLASLDDEDDADLAPGADDKDPEGIRRIMLEESVQILADYIRMRQPMTAKIH